VTTCTSSAIGAPVSSARGSVSATTITGAHASVTAW